MPWFGVAALIGTILVSTPAAAYSFTSLVFFGDSLTDQGRNGQTAPVMWPAVLRTDTSITSGQNYAIGGSFTSNQPSPIFGDESYLGQVNSFVATNPSTAGTPAAGIWTGTNNIWIGSGQGQSAATIAASASADVRTGIVSLSGVGVKNVLLLGVYDLSLTNAYILAGTNSLATRATAAAASQSYNAQLAALSVPGTTIQFFNIANLINQLQTHPGLYGFTQVMPLLPGVTCNATCQQTSIFADTIHLTSAAQTLIGNYVASGNPIYNSASFTYGAIGGNYLGASLSAPLIHTFARAETEGFLDAQLTRLDRTRDGAPGPALAAGGTKPQGPWSLIADAVVSGGTLAHAGSYSGTNGDLSSMLVGLTLGAEDRIQSDMRFGAVLTYGHTDSDLTQTLGAKTQLDAFQAGVFGSLSEPDGFIDAIAAAGYTGAHQQRIGSFGELDSAPGVTTYGAAINAGYLFTYNGFRSGPIAGFAYAHTGTNAYRDSGPALYQIAYASSSSDALDGSVGWETRLANPATYPIDPVLAVTYDHAFRKNAQAIGATYVYLPTQSLPVTVNPDTDYVKVSFGSEIRYDANLTGSLSAFATRGLQGAATYGLNGGIAWHF